MENLNAPVRILWSDDDRGLWSVWDGDLHLFYTTEKKVADEWAESGHRIETIDGGK